MNITLFGAAGDVTGSAYFVETKDAAVMVDFGVFQGGKEADTRNREFPPINIKGLSAVLLTHAHLDHTGRLPLLTKNGYDKPIYATAATIDVTALILHDSVKVQAMDYEHLTKRRARRGKAPLQTLYSAEDAEKAIALLTPAPYNTYFPVAKGIQARIHEAGHILGSGSIELTVEEDGQKKVVVFSGDIGPQGMAILNDPEPYLKADLVFMESTYGDRDHRSLKDTLAEGEQIIREGLKNKGKILVPSFAVGRTQQLLYYLAAAAHKGDIPDFPVFIDSPMAIEATKLYMKHEELYDKEARELSESGELKTDLEHVTFCSTADESKALNFIEGSCMILAGAGMCNAGRILHHLRHNLWRPETSVVIVGYQGEGTLGRMLIDGAQEVRIFGEKIAVKAQIHSLGGLSAHAGQTDLINWFSAIAPSRPKLVLSHGEDKGRVPLASLIKQKFGITAILPEFGQKIVI